MKHWEATKICGGCSPDLSSKALPLCKQLRMFFKISEESKKQRPFRSKDTLASFDSARLKETRWHFL